jgi:hypothetical protein
MSWCGSGSDGIESVSNIDPAPEAINLKPGTARLRHETGISVRQDALDPGFHAVGGQATHRRAK